MPVIDADIRIEKLSTASVRRVIEPDVEVPGEIGPGAILAPHLLSVAGLGLELSPEQLATLSREEVASIIQAGLRFEAVLMSGFTLALASTADLTDPRAVYALHEVGEETRHSRLFIRLLSQLQPQAKNPLDTPLIRRLQKYAIGAITHRPALFDVLVLAGEEIPDLIQKLAVTDAATDPFIAAINRYHRQEEARHLTFARTVLAEHWASATWDDRFAVRYVAPAVIKGMFQMMVHPGVYTAIGLPGWATWRQANRTPERVALRHQATRAVLAALLDAEALRPGRIPGDWRRLCGVDGSGQPIA